MENATIASISPGPEPAGLVTYKLKLFERIPAAVSASYRNTLIDTIEEQVDVPSLDCTLRWAVQAAYHNMCEPRSHEVVALCLCFGSGALEGETLRAQRGFYANRSDLAHHMHDWSLQGLIDKHNAKIRTDDNKAPLTISANNGAAASSTVDSGKTHPDEALTVARAAKRPASAVEDTILGPTGRRSSPPVDPFTIHHDSKGTPRLSSLFKGRRTSPRRAAAPAEPMFSQAVLDRLAPSFMGSTLGGFAQLNQFRNSNGDVDRHKLPPLGRTGSLTSSYPGLGDTGPSGTSGDEDTKGAAAAAIAADIPGDNAKAKNPFVVAETATETRLAALAAHIAEHHQRAREKLSHAEALREEHAKLLRTHPLEDTETMKEVYGIINEGHGLASRSLRHQEEAVGHVVEAGRLESQRAEETLRGINQRMDRIQGVAVGTANTIKREKEMCASFAARQVAEITARKQQQGKRRQNQPGPRLS